MKKLIFVLVVVMALVLGTIGTALAITYGEPDGDGHPYVGMYYFSDWEGDWRCSGTLISPRVFLTAGHCTYEAFNARVSFDTEITEDSKWYSGTAYAHPSYDPYWTEFPNTYDVGVIVLDKPVKMKVYGEIPDIGVLDGLDTSRGHQDLIVRTVGYGDQSIKPQEQSDLVRYTSTSMLENLRSNNNDGYNMQTSNNPSVVHGEGGACFGDSGGPVFYPADSDTVVGIVSFGMNWNCKGADWSYRVDTQDTQDFVNAFLKTKGK
jgi:hypothetical protein